METAIFIPTLSHWEHGNKWTGERGRARFYIAPEDGRLNAQLWLGPLCRERSQIDSTASFPISEEGLRELAAWLEEGAARLDPDLEKV